MELKTFYNTVYNLLLTLAYLRKSSRFFLYSFAFAKLVVKKTPQIIHKPLANAKKRCFYNYF